ncbi:MAG: signal peptidase I [Haloarculaceae archaeon]
MRRLSPPSRAGSRAVLGTGWRLTRRVIELALLVALVTVVAAFAVFAVPQLVGAEHSYVVLSGSMEPSMSPGDVILVDEVGFDALRTGDVVSFRGESGTITTHRVADVVEADGQRAIWTKGDNNEERDPRQLTEAALVGRAMTASGTLLAIPYIGLVVEAAGSGMGTYFLLFIPLTLLVLNEIYTRLGPRSAPKPRPGTGRSPTPEWLAANGDVPAGVTAHLVAEGDVDTLHLNPARPIAADAPGGSSESDPSSGAALSPRDVSLSLLVLGVLAAYSGWLFLDLRSVLAAMVFAGGAVGVVLGGLVRIDLWRRGNGLGRPTGFHRRDMTVTLPLLVLLGLFSGWMALSALSVVSSIVFAGSVMSALLLVLVRVSLWRTARGRRSSGGDGRASGADPRADSPASGRGGQQ